MVHAGRTLKAIRNQKGFTGAGLGRAADLGAKPLRQAEATPYFRLRADNLEKVLSALEISYEEFVRRVAVGWDRSPESQIRLELLNVISEADKATLHELAAHVERSFRDPPHHRGRAG